MAGVKGMHKRASTSPEYAESLRARIDAPRIAKALLEHIAGKREMAATQVTAALGLLRKVLPDLSSTEMKGQIDHTHSIVEADRIIESRLFPVLDGRAEAGTPGDTAH